MTKAISELIDISSYAGARVDYTQGGGGNTSVKYGDVMYIKASGFKLKDIDENTAYVPMDLKKIKAFYESVDLSDGRDYEALNKQVTAEATLKQEGLAALRPSVEVGFHSVLKKYVIHTHSIYANLLTCCKNGEELAEKIFGKSDFGYVFLPYVDPGFMLSVKMGEALKEYKEKTGKYAEVIFMKNHGLVVNGDDKERVISLNEEVNNAIIAYFGLKDEYRTVSLKQTGENVYLSETKVINDFVKTHTVDKAMLDKNSLYPDQLVYLNNMMAFSPEKIQIKNGSVEYHTTLKEAQTLEETLFAYLFVLKVLAENNLELSLMNEKDIDFINNWEAEKYRRSLSK